MWKGEASHYQIIIITIYVLLKAQFQIVIDFCEKEYLDLNRNNPT